MANLRPPTEPYRQPVREVDIVTESQDRRVDLETLRGKVREAVLHKALELDTPPTRTQIDYIVQTVLQDVDLEAVNNTISVMGYENGIGFIVAELFYNASEKLGMEATSEAPTDTTPESEPANPDTLEAKLKNPEQRVSLAVRDKIEQLVPGLEDRVRRAERNAIDRQSLIGEIITKDLWLVDELAEAAEGTSVQPQFRQLAAHIKGQDKTGSIKETPNFAPRALERGTQEYADLVRALNIRTQLADHEISPNEIDLTQMRQVQESLLTMAELTSQASFELQLMLNRVVPAETDKKAHEKARRQYKGLISKEEKLRHMAAILVCDVVFLENQVTALEAYLDDESATADEPTPQQDLPIKKAEPNRVAVNPEVVHAEAVKETILFENEQRLRDKEKWQTLSEQAGGFLDELTNQLMAAQETVKQEKVAAIQANIRSIAERLTHATDTESLTKIIKSLEQAQAELATALDEVKMKINPQDRRVVATALQQVKRVEEQMDSPVEEASIEVFDDSIFVESGLLSVMRTSFETVYNKDQDMVGYPEPHFDAMMAGILAAEALKRRGYAGDGPDTIAAEACEQLMQDLPNLTQAQLKQRLAEINTYLISMIGGIDGLTEETPIIGTTEVPMDTLNATTPGAVPLERLQNPNISQVDIAFFRREDYARI